MDLFKQADVWSFVAVLVILVLNSAVFWKMGFTSGVRETMARQQQIEAMKFWMKEGGYANE
ncbi:MAG: hypothetical protein ABSG35_14140 [Syntrophobacteraceae bacterium]|jgi:hypothetical protein